MKTSHIASLTALMFIVGCAQQPTTAPTATSSTAPTTTTTPSVTKQAQATATDTATAAKAMAQETKNAAVEQTQTVVAGGKTAVTEVVTTTKQTASNTATTAAKSAASNAVASAKTAVSNATTAATTTASGASVTTMPDWIKTPTYDCRGCHAIDKKVIGPAWRDVAKRYKGDADAEAMLIQKVKTGGKGNWTSVTGGIPMTPHPKLTDAELKKVVDFVLSLD